jgi:KipI family sensor histidine kinase inhibitor
VTEVRPFGEAALQVTLGDDPDPGTLARVHALARRLEADRATGTAWGAPVPGMTTLLVPFDPRAWSDEQARGRLGRLLDDLAADATEPPTASHVIPVRYGGPDGPDLAEVADRLGLTPERVVELHASVGYTVYILGFMPGFGYLGELPEELSLPRRDTPRTRVPAGSVAIAGRQTAVYPAATPGGWHLIGRTDLRLWDIDIDPPAVLRPGDRVRFEPLG